MESQIIESATLIERWENVALVLDNMPEHERQKHWDMAQWGYKNDCGTIACAAGHCGLNPWFRERGFTLDFSRDGAARISDVPAFFGFEGSQRIFYNSEQRPVETVLGEVREFLGELRKAQELIAEYSLPAIGTELPDGVYAGICFSKDAPYLLVVGPEYDGYLPWPRAMEWATNLEVDGRNDYFLPSRREGVALYARVRHLFRRSWYWLGEQHEGNASYAWYQNFDNGNQNYWHKDNYDRARAVRRLPIQSFTNSVLGAVGRAA